MEGRRVLSMTSLMEVMPEVDRLLLGHRTIGKWSLGQICNHLASPMICTVEGFPFKVPWLLRKTIARPILRKILRDGRMMAGAPLPRRFAPKPGLDARAEAEGLRATIDHFVRQSGPFFDHPFFGSMTVAEWNRYHAIHSAHHLGFVIPDPEASA